MSVMETTAFDQFVNERRRQRIDLLHLAAQTYRDADKKYTTADLIATATELANFSEAAPR